MTYGADGARMKCVTDTGEEETETRTRYYLGGVYECDVTGGEEKNGVEASITERLYLGGDAYSAPMVLVRNGSGNGTLYNIGRDVQGSITHIASTSGTLVAEYSYDPWGRLRNPATHALYAPGSEPDLMLGRGYTGHEHLKEAGLINMNARLYDPYLGRFLSPDPYIQDATSTQAFNRYSYCLNNPLRYTDESGEFIFSLFLGPIGAFLDAACWGAVIGSANYTMSVAFSEGGFNNWSWSEFGKSTGWGAISGAVTFGIGELFQAAGNFAGQIGTELIRSATHGIAQGTISYLQGGSFWSGFASSTLGSLSSSGYVALGLVEKLGVVGQLGFGAISGGVGAVLTGGNFFQGACIGLTTTGLNHIQHNVERIRFFNRLRNHYHNNSGEDFILTEQEFNYLINKGSIDLENATIGKDGYYTASIDFYGSDPDLKYSFGKATVKFSKDNNQTQYVGFYDLYDFDWKSTGNRSITAELITRLYGKIFGGTPFNIFFGKNLFK